MIKNFIKSAFIYELVLRRRQTKELQAWEQADKPEGVDPEEASGMDI